MTPSQRLVPVALAALLASSCATVPYDYGAPPPGPRANLLRAGEPQFERGRPHLALDVLGNVFGLPSKLLLLDWRIENHAVSAETERALCTFLEANGLHHVKVRINQYAPGREWKRLARNREVAGGWRWSLGLLSVLTYTVLPQRVFGGDNFNPYTNTIHVYSDVRPVALHEGGHAKDFARRRRKGTWAALRSLPLVPLYQEAWATSDALGWERERGGAADERRAYRSLYPAFGTYVGGEGARWISGSSWVVYAVQYGAVAVGHAVGWTRSLFVPDERLRPAPPGPEPEAAPGAASRCAAPPPEG